MILNIDETGPKTYKLTHCLPRFKVYALEVRVPALATAKVEVVRAKSVFGAEIGLRIFIGRSVAPHPQKL